MGDVVSLLNNQPPHVVFGVLKDFDRTGNDYVGWFSLQPAQALHAKVHGLIGEQDFAQRRLGVRLFVSEMRKFYAGTEVALIFDKERTNPRLLQRAVRARDYRPE